MGITLNPGTLLNGNGVDVASLVTASLAPQNAQLTAMRQQETTLQTESGLMTSMNGDLNNLSSAINALTDVLGPLTAMLAQSSQSTILTASAEPGAKAGTHTIVVSTLLRREHFTPTRLKMAARQSFRMGCRAQT